LQGKTAIDGFHALIAAVIERAIDDLKGVGVKCPKKDTDWAMAFILSDTCEAYCLELGIDYETIREKAAALSRKIIAKKEKPRKARYANSPGQLSGNRPFRASKMRPVTLATGTASYSSPRGSPKSLANSR
jgi:hypothetical protein